MNIKSILVIEDEEDLRDELIEMLSFEGFNPIGASDGKQGVYLAKEFLPDLIICDIMMPNMDGIEVLKSINKMPQTEGIPFIFLTALSTHVNIRQGMALGADDYLVKPFSISDLLDSINVRERKAKKLEDRIEKTISNLIENVENRFPDLNPAELADIGFDHDLYKNSNSKNPFSNISSELLKLIEVSSTLDSLLKIIDKSLSSDNFSEKEEDTFIALRNRLIEPSVISDARNVFLSRFDKYKPGYLESIKMKHPSLSNDELLLCCSVHLKYTGRQTAQIFGIETSSVYKNKYRLKLKLGLGKHSKIESYLESFV